MTATAKTLFVGTAGLLLLGTLALAGEHERARELREAGDILPLEKILEQARADRPGRVIEAELEREDGRYTYELELVDDRGVVWEVWYDARTGELIRSEKD